MLRKDIARTAASAAALALFVALGCNGTSDPNKGNAKTASTAAPTTAAPAATTSATTTTTSAPVTSAAAPPIVVPPGAAGAGTTGAGTTPPATPPSSSTSTSTSTGSSTSTGTTPATPPSSSTSTSTGTTVTRRFAYTANEKSNDLTSFFYDPADGTLKVSAPSVPTGKLPSAIVTWKTYVYVTCHDSNEVWAYEAGAILGTLSQIGTQAAKAGTGPQGLAVGGSFLFVANEQSNDVSVFALDAGTGAIKPVATVAAGTNPWAVAATANAVYVANRGSNDVMAYSVAATGTLTKIGTYATGSKPTGIVLDPTGKLAFVANSGSGDVSTFSVSSTGALASLGTTSTGSGCRAVAITPDGKFLYTANATFWSCSGLSVTPSGSLAKVQSNVGNQLGDNVSVAADPAGKYLYAVLKGGDAVQPYAIDPSNGKLTELTATTQWRWPQVLKPTAIAISP